ncbi:MAG TPA: hypothetical protein VFX02_02770 [Gammaproteobacteria bacterium]|nr:hypothetical protein [Gammaproteobacteria bacterium]
MATAQSSKVTIDHNEIRRWVEERQGRPATVKATGSSEEPGLLRIDFPGGAGEDRLEAISWEAFFEKFDQNRLAFVYQDNLKSGEESRFFKFVRREDVKAKPTRH